MNIRAQSEKYGELEPRGGLVSLRPGWQAQASFLSQWSPEMMRATLRCSCKLGSLVSHKTPHSANTLLHSVQPSRFSQQTPLPVFLLVQRLGGGKSFKQNNSLQPPRYSIPIKSMWSLFHCRLIESIMTSVWVLLASQGR